MRESFISRQNFQDPRTSASFPKQLLHYNCYILKEISAGTSQSKMKVQSKAVIEQECCAVSWKPRWWAVPDVFASPGQEAGITCPAAVIWIYVMDVVYCFWFLFHCPGFGQDHLKFCSSHERERPEPRGHSLRPHIIVRGRGKGVCFEENGFLPGGWGRQALNWEFCRWITFSFV